MAQTKFLITGATGTTRGILRSKMRGQSKDRGKGQVTTETI